MRTRLCIDDDVLAAANEIGRRLNKSTGEVISGLARKALADGWAGDPHVRAQAERYGFSPLPARGVVVTNDIVNGLREDRGEFARL